MSSSVLFDAPGPRTLVRHRAYSVVAAVTFLGVAALVIWKLYVEGNFEASIWEKLFASNVWEAIGEGAVNTIRAAAIAIVTSVLFGALLAVARLSDHAVFRWPATVVVEFFRAVPLLLLIFFIFYGLGPKLGDAGTIVALIGGLTLYNGAVLAEVFRAGVHAVPKGQSEAAYAIGMRKTQVMAGILAPQAVRFMLPAIISQCVVVLKDTSLGFVVGYEELLRQGTTIAQFVNSNLMTFVVIGVVYIALNSAVSAFATWLEKRMARRGRAAAQQVKAAEGALPMG